MLLQWSHVLTNVETAAWPPPFSVTVASMEPRPHERGNGFAEAGKMPSGKLQWSHVLTNVETYEHHHQRGHQAKASMEPRPHERGNNVLRAVQEGIYFASMEPRPHERGNWTRN